MWNAFLISMFCILNSQFDVRKLALGTLSQSVR